MITRKHIITVTLALALGAGPVAAQDSFDLGIAVDDFFLRLGIGDRGVGYSHGGSAYHTPRLHRDRRIHRVRHHHGQRHHRRYIEGHWAYDTVRRYVEGYYETVHVPAVYRTETFRGRHGRIHTRQVMVCPAHTEQVWRPGYWTTETVRRWVPGYWEAL